MNNWFRLIYIPLIVIFIGTILLMFNLISIDITLPISYKWLAIIVGASLMGLLGFDFSTRGQSSWQHPEPEDPPKSEAVIYPKVLEETVEAFQEAEHFASKIDGRVRIVVDVEDDPEDSY